MLSQLESLTTQTRVLHIYGNNQVTVPESRETAPQIKEGAQPVILEIHSLTAAQLNQINELERSVTPPLQIDQEGKPVLDENKDPKHNYEDPAYIKRKTEIALHARCLAIYHGCDSIRADLAAANKDHIHLLSILSQGLVETISAHIINAESIAYRPDFFLPASFSSTQG
jgi:hypothetical protein